MADEPAIDALIELGRASEKTIGVPVFTKTSMDFVQLTNALETLPLDKFGIRQECANNRMLDKFDLIIVPGRAFTPGVNRIIPQIHSDAVKTVNAVAAVAVTTIA